MSVSVIYIDKCSHVSTLLLMNWILSQGIKTYYTILVYDFIYLVSLPLTFTQETCPLKKYHQSGTILLWILKIHQMRNVKYDQNRIIRPEPELEFRFRLAGTGSRFSNSGSGLKNRNKHFEIPVPV